MTEQLSHIHPTRLHQEVWKLLPWYANGTLTREEAAEVEAHLATCPACQVELTRCHEISTAVHVERQDAWSPSPEHFRELLAQVDAVEAHEASNNSGWARWQPRLASWLKETPRPVRWAMAFQGVLVLVLASALVWQTAPSPPELYETLSSEAEPVLAGRMQVRVIFAEDKTEKELRELLSRIEATIVQGPSPAGVYTVEVPQAGSALESVLKELRAHPKVRLAEPVSTGPAP
jgi:anti-sigma factor RsiW